MIRYYITYGGVIYYIVYAESLSQVIECFPEAIPDRQTIKEELEK